MKAIKTTIRNQVIGRQILKEKTIIQYNNKVNNWKKKLWKNIEYRKRNLRNKPFK